MSDDDGLFAWLANEEELRGAVRVEPGDPVPEAMGMEHVLVTAIDTIPVLAGSICGYLIARQRLRRGELRLTLNRGEQKVDLVVTGDTDPGALARDLLLGTASEGD
jgi:hypothetical protein